MGGPSRLPVATRRDIGVPAWVFARLAGRVMGTQPPAVFTTLARTRGLFWGWLHFAGGLMPGGRLPRRDTELVILRVAVRKESDYEFAHHRRLARRAGLSAAQIEGVRAAESDGWSGRDRVLLRAVDELLDTGDLGDATFAALHDELGDRMVVEFLLLVGHYQMLAATLRTLRVEPDRPR